MKNKNNTNEKIRFIIALITIVCMTNNCAAQRNNATNVISAAEGSEGRVVWIPVEDMKCRDGSSTGIGVQLSTDSNQRNLAIYMRGGNACFNIPTCQVTDFKYDRESFNRDVSSFLSQGIFNNSNINNPTRNWHKIFVPYCTGDVHSGNLLAPSLYLASVTADSSAQMSLRIRRNTSLPVAQYEAGNFVGQQNMRIVIEQARSYFTNVSQVLLTGSSAGGFGVFLNYDMAAQAFGSNVNVVGISDAAPIFDNKSIGPDCGLQFLSILWGLTLPSDYSQFVTSNHYTEHRLTGIYRYLSRKYPSRQFGLLSHVSDRVISSFYTALSITSAVVDRTLLPNFVVRDANGNTVRDSSGNPVRMLNQSAIPLPVSNFRVGEEAFPGVVCSDTTTRVLASGSLSAGADIVQVTSPDPRPGVYIRDTTYRRGLETLRDSIFNSSDTNALRNWKVFYDYNDFRNHTFLPRTSTFNRNSSNNISVAQWVARVINGSAQHERVD